MPTARAGELAASDGTDVVHGIDDAVRRLGAAAVARLVSAGLNSASSVVVVALMVRLLGTSSYGVLAFFLSIVALLAGLSRAGWGLATVQTLASLQTKTARGRIVSAAMALALVTSAVGAAVLLAIVPAASRDLDGASRGILLCGLIAALVGTNFSAAASSIARGSARPVLSELPHLVIALARLIALLALAVAGSRSLGSVALALGAAGVAGLVVSVASARSCVRASALPRERPTPGIRILVTASVPFVLQTVAAMMIARLDVVFLGLVSSPAAVGEYEATLRMTERLFQLVPFLLLAQYLPVATTLWQGGHVEEFERLYRGVTRLSYWVIVPIFITLAAFPEPLLRLVFGASFPVHPQVVWVLVAGLVPNAVLATTWMALAATGERRMLVQVSGLTLVVMVASAALFIPWLGMVGAAAATSVSMLTQQVAAAKALHRRTGIRPMHQKFLGLLAGSALLMLVAFAFRWRIVDGSIWSVALTSAAVLLAWLAWVWRTERPGMRWLFNMALAPQARRT